MACGHSSCRCILAEIRGGGEDYRTAALFDSPERRGGFGLLSLKMHSPSVSY
jgi:hypothetical protein